MNHSVNGKEKNIELIDIIRVLWRWKVLIIVGTAFAILVMAYVNTLITPEYLLNMVVRPGTLNISNNGQITYVDSAENIKAMIEAKTFNQEIKDLIRAEKKFKVPDQIKLSVALPPGTASLDISYITSDIDRGVFILNQLGTLLEAKFIPIADYYRKEIERDIENIKLEIQRQEPIIQNVHYEIKMIDNRVHELQDDIKRVHSNTERLIEARNKILSSKQTGVDSISVLLATNSIQGNISIANNFKNELQNNMLTRDKLSLEIKNIQSTIKLMEENIKKLSFKKDIIGSIRILKAPSSPIQVEPDKKRNLKIAFVAGLTFMILLSFFIEYLMHHKIKE
ncbi:MAG: hypothetical protein C4522_07340 [Desulfobacteraceae bacterium]|nr:MAG: hypothetical protein C4522_07340 [Desulfobacteraceae bacterium]